MDSADEELWDKKSIKALIELVWHQYRPIIIQKDLLPFALDIILVLMLFTGMDPFTDTKWN